MNDLKKVTVIGAGWLGMPLIASLLQQNYQVIATKQSADVLEKTTKILTPFAKNSQHLQVQAFSQNILERETSAIALLKPLFSNRKIIITIPPSGFLSPFNSENRHQNEDSYAAFIRQIADLAQLYQAQEIIYTSSSSVYGDSSGIIHEALPAMPKTKSAQAIFKAEKALQNREIPITILRLAGLIGHGRHPIFSLQGRNNIRSPFNAINLLHIQDLIEAITAILRRPKAPWDNHIYNLVAPTHPNRKSYYQTLAKHLNLALPLFEPPKPELKRIIDGEKITEEGDFNYRITDLVHASLDKII